MHCFVKHEEVHVSQFATQCPDFCKDDCGGNRNGAVPLVPYDKVAPWESPPITPSVIV